MFCLDDGNGGEAKTRDEVQKNIHRMKQNRFRRDYRTLFQRFHFKCYVFVYVIGNVQFVEDKMI